MVPGREAANPRPPRGALGGTVTRIGAWLASEPAETITSVKGDLGRWHPLKPL